MPCHPPPELNLPNHCQDIRRVPRERACPSEHVPTLPRGEPRAHEAVRDEQENEVHRGAIAHALLEAARPVEELVEHDRVDDTAERGPRGGDAHHERAPALEIVRYDAEAGNVGHADREADAEALTEEHLRLWASRAHECWSVYATRGCQRRKLPGSTGLGGTARA